MSLVAEVERLFAETGDAAMHASRAIAAEVEKLVHGAPIADFKALEDKIVGLVETKLAEVGPAMQAHVDSIIANSKAQYEAATAQVSAIVEQLKALPAPTAAAPSAAPVAAQPAAPAPAAPAPDTAAAAAPAAPAAPAPAGVGAPVAL